MPRRPVNPHIREVRPHNPKAKEFPKRKLRIEAFFLFVFVLIIIYIIGYFYTNARRPEVSQMRVEMGVIAQPTSFSGVIIRDEAVYYATDAGALMFHVENHERVRAGFVVASIQDAAQVAVHRANLADIDQQAVNAHRQRTGVAINEGEIVRRNQAILTYVDSAAFDLATGNISGIFRLGDTVRQSLQSRNMLYFSDEVAMLGYANERERALAGMARAISNVPATSSGIFSNMVDGLESQLNIANLSNISRELTTAAVQLPTFYSPEVAAGDALFRIVRSNDWFIAAYVNRAYADTWSPNTTVTLFVEEAAAIVPLAVQVHSLTDAGPDEVLVVFRTNNDLMRFLDRRNITFSLARGAQEGFKIPQTAIVERSRFPVPAEFVFIENNVRAVNLMTGGGVVIESVTGSFSSNGELFFIMADSTRLRVGDVLVMGDAQFILDTVNTVPGVFVTNIGATQFREVNITGFFDENADYIILDPSRNPNLRLFDRIVSDARAVSDRLLLH